MNITQPQLNLLRSRPQQTNLFLSIYRPKTIMAAQVTGSYNVGDFQISYYGVTTGSYQNLYPDMTVLVGNSEGSDDVARIRLRNATGTYIQTAENAINWRTGLYLTFIDQVDVEAIYPRIIQDPNNQTNVIFYKDWNIPYSNQNTIFGTFPNAGPHRAGFLTSGTFYFTATGTYNVNGDSLTYSWNFEGGTPTGSNSLTPGDVKWNATGHYRVRLRVTSSSGAVDDTYRYVSIYNHPNTGNNPPILRWELKSLSGSRSEGGYTASFKVWDNLGDVQPNAIVVVFQDSWYGNTQVNIGGNAQNNPSIAFVGYIIGDSIKVNWQESSVEFSVGSVSEIMKNTEGFSVSCETKAAATTWFELTEMTVAKAMYHYLRWHSTVLKVADFQYLGDDRYVQYFDSDRGSLYDAIDSFLRDGLLGELVSDRQGKLWAELSPYGYFAPFSSIPNYMAPLQKQDWMGDVSITERRNSEMAFMELGGIAYYGTASNTFSALLSNAPSTAPLYFGKSDRKEGLILTSQSQLNQISGNYLAYNNTRFPDVTMSLAGNYGNLDIAPQERMYLVLNATDTLRKSIQDLPYIVDSMEWKYSSVNKTFLPDVTLRQIATGTAGVTVEIPTTPPENGYSYPKLSLPPLPSFNNSVPVGSTVPTRVLFLDDNGGLIYTENFDAASPDYYQVNAGLGGATGWGTFTDKYKLIDQFFVTPNGAVYVWKSQASDAGHYAAQSEYYFVARAPNIGGTFVTLYDPLILPPPGGAGSGVNVLAYNPNVPETVMIVTNEGSTTCTAHVGGGGVYSNGATNLPRTGGGDGMNSGLVYSGFGAGGWVYTKRDAYYVIAADGASLGAPQTLTGINVQGADRDVASLITGKSSLTFRMYATGDNAGSPIRNFLVGDNNFATNTWSNPPMATFQGFACDPTGNLIMAQGYGGKGKSSDGGSSWANLPNLPPGTWRFAYAGGDSVSSSRWIAANAVIRFSPDFGNTWIEKTTTSLTSIVPLPNIIGIQVIG